MMVTLVKISGLIIIYGLSYITYYHGNDYFQFT